MKRVLLLLVPAIALADAPKGFARYPGARKLCDEHVSGNRMHITWTTHATADAPAKVVAHYEKALARKATGDREGAKTIDLDGDRHVTIYPAASNDKFPNCGSKPKATEKTVVMLSTAIR